MGPWIRVFLVVVGPEYLALPDIPPMGADIPAWNARKQFHSIFQKQKFFLMKNLNLCA
jgi:hypothetical protein